MPGTPTSARRFGQDSPRDIPPPVRKLPNGFFYRSFLSSPLVCSLIGSALFVFLFIILRFLRPSPMVHSASAFIWTLISSLQSPLSAPVLRLFSFFSYRPYVHPQAGGFSSLGRLTHSVCFALFFVIFLIRFYSPPRRFGRPSPRFSRLFPILPPPFSAKRSLRTLLVLTGISLFPPDCHLPPRPDQLLFLCDIMGPL